MITFHIHRVRDEDTIEDIIGVRVYASVGAMRRGVARYSDGLVETAGANGMCLHWKGEACGRDGERAVVFLSRTCMGAGVVAHEMVHAGRVCAGMGKRRVVLGRNEVGKAAEEQLAWVVGELVRCFWLGWYDAMEDEKKV